MLESPWVSLLEARHTNGQRFYATVVPNGSAQYQLNGYFEIQKYTQKKARFYARAVLIPNGFNQYQLKDGHLTLHIKKSKFE